MTVKIQLDTQALDQLIKSDPDWETDLRNSIFQNFTKRHVKQLANEKTYKELIQELLTSLKHEIRDFIFKKVETNYRGEITNYELSEEFKKTIDDYIDKKIIQKYYDSIDKKLETIAETLENTIDRKIEIRINEFIRNGFNKHVDKIMKVFNKIPILAQETKNAQYKELYEMLIKDRVENDCRGVDYSGFTGNKKS